jgi:hypothetical protein
VGLSEEQLAVLKLARADRQAGRPLSVDPVALALALRHPGARLYDEQFVRQERARARG